jgi:hypothetical protein
MNQPSRRKLALSIQTIRVLGPARLRAAQGGTALVGEVDPPTAPVTDRDGGGAAGRTERCDP